MALAREQHFGRAADACGVTQPTLSAGLKQLESTLGVLLVQRGSRFIGLTPEGERTLDWARRIVGDTRSMRQEITALRHGLAGRLRIAAVPTALAMVSALTTPFRARHPAAAFARDPGAAEHRRGRPRPPSPRHRAARPPPPGPPLPRPFPPAALTGRAARPPRQRARGRGPPRAALPATPGHAKPPHH